MPLVLIITPNHHRGGRGTLLIRAKALHAGWTFREKRNCDWRFLQYWSWYQCLVVNIQSLVKYLFRDHVTCPLQNFEFLERDILKRGCVLGWFFRGFIYGFVLVLVVWLFGFLFVCFFFCFCFVYVFFLFLFYFTNLNTTAQLLNLFIFGNYL